MLAATEPGCRKISAMVATQLLKTTLIENITGYHAHLDPCPIIILMPLGVKKPQRSAVFWPLSRARAKYGRG